MTLVYLGLYILLLAGIWCFFIVARIHAYKFKNMSTHIPIVTNMLFFVLLILSIAGIILCFFLGGNQPEAPYVEEYEDNNRILEQEIF